MHLSVHPSIIHGQAPKNIPQPHFICQDIGCTSPGHSATVSYSTLLNGPIVSLLILFILFSDVFVLWYMSIFYALLVLLVTMLVTTIISLDDVLYSYSLLLCLLQEWWTHLWLNEGFASWIEYLCLDFCFPEFDIWTQFASTDFTKALELDALRNSHPIEVGEPLIVVRRGERNRQCAGGGTRDMTCRGGV